MVSRFRTWSQQIKQHPVATGVIGFVVVAVIALVFAVVWFNGTGFDGYNQETIAQTTNGPSAGTVVRTEVYQPGKTLWDWLQLLIIPAVLVVGGFLLNYTTSRNEREAAEKRAQHEQKIATDNQSEQALQAYIDNMAALLLENDLSKPAELDKVRKIGRVRTLTVLPRCDERRKAIVLQFLYESGLINKDNAIIDLDGADFNGIVFGFTNLQHANLSGANICEANLAATNLEGATLNKTKLLKTELSQVNFSGADLSKAFLTQANLTFANLSGAKLVFSFLNHANLSAANLSGANLSGAVFDEANLNRANLSGATGITNEELEKKAKSLQGATMPDGTKHA